MEIEQTQPINFLIMYIKCEIRTPHYHIALDFLLFVYNYYILKATFCEYVVIVAK